ncbi:hypothetical protein AgCh_002268 [Apium graveolens]
MASNGNANRKNAFVVAALILLMVTPSYAENLSLWNRWKARINNNLFPRVEVTLFNESEDKVLYMCSFGDEKERSLRVLEGGQQNSWNFTQFAFPLHWCYLYVNENRHGFFWAYGVRSRCIKCFWKVGKFPFLYRSDRNRWERQQLFPPQNLKFNLTMPKDA